MKAVAQQQPITGIGCLSSLPGWFARALTNSRINCISRIAAITAIRSLNRSVSVLRPEAMDAPALILPVVCRHDFRDSSRGNRSKFGMSGISGVDGLEHARMDATHDTSIRGCRSCIAMK